MQPACRCLHGGEPERVAVAQQVAGIGNARGVQLGTGLSASTACGGGRAAMCSVFRGGRGRLCHSIGRHRGGQERKALTCGCRVLGALTAPPPRLSCQADGCGGGSILAR